MDTFYAHTDTHVEVALAALLLPGRYEVRLALGDAAQGVQADEPASFFVVEAAPGAPSPDGAVPGLTDVSQSAGVGSSSMPVWIVTLLVGLVLGGMITGSLVLIARRRRQGDQRVD